MEYYYSGLLLARLFSRLGMLLSVAVRWLLLPYHCRWPASSSSAGEVVGPEAGAAHHSVSAAQAVRDSLHSSTYGEITGAKAAATTCAVCLSEVRRWDSVWELRNCTHVFHKACLDRWLDHDEHLTCPLCRAPLLSQPVLLPAPSEHSWAVEHLVYLFGDDLLFAAAAA